MVMKRIVLRESLESSQNFRQQVLENPPLSPTKARPHPPQASEASKGPSETRLDHDQPRPSEIDYLLLRLLLPFKQEQIALERSARLNLNPDRGDKGDGGGRRLFTRGRSLCMIICKKTDPPDDHLQMAGPSG